MSPEELAAAPRYTLAWFDKQLLIEFKADADGARIVAWAALGGPQ